MGLPFAESFFTVILFALKCDSLVEMTFRLQFSRSSILIWLNKCQIAYKAKTDHRHKAVG